MLQNISDKVDPELKVSVVDIEEGTRPSRSGHRLRSCISILQRSFRRRNDSEESPWPKLVRKTLYLLTAIVGLATIAVMYEESTLLETKIAYSQTEYITPFSSTWLYDLPLPSMQRLAWTKL
jgi:hypothetical protein